MFFMAMYFSQGKLFQLLFDTYFPFVIIYTQNMMDILYNTDVHIVW